MNNNFGDCCSVLIFPNVVASFLGFEMFLGLGSATTSLKAMPSVSALLSNQLCRKHAASRELLCGKSWIGLLTIRRSLGLFWGSVKHVSGSAMCLQTAADRPARWGGRQNGIALSGPEIRARWGSNRQCRKKWQALHIEATVSNEHPRCMRFSHRKDSWLLLPLCHSSPHRCWLGRTLPRTYHPLINNIWVMGPTILKTRREQLYWKVGMKNTPLILITLASTARILAWTPSLQILNQKLQRNSGYLK